MEPEKNEKKALHCPGQDYKILQMIKKVLITLIAAASLLSVGCAATATVGKTANPPWVDASANKDGVSVTLPFVKAGITPEKE